MKPNSRSKMMSFRLPDEQYQQFRAICMYRGIGNVSELVRAAVNQFLHDQDGAEPVGESLDARMARVERQVHTLSAEFDNFQRASRSPSNGLDAARNELPLSET